MAFFRPQHHLSERWWYWSERQDLYAAWKDQVIHAELK